MPYEKRPRKTTSTAVSSRKPQDWSAHTPIRSLCPHILRISSSSASLNTMLTYKQCKPNPKSKDRLTAQLEQANSSFVAARKGDTSSREREEGLQRLENAYFKYKEIVSNLEVGRKFYNDLAKIVGRFRDGCKAFIYERREEAIRLESYVLFQSQRRLPRIKLTCAATSPSHPSPPSPFNSNKPNSHTLANNSPTYMLNNKTPFKPPKSRRFHAHTIPALSLPLLTAAGRLSEVNILKKCRHQSRPAPYKVLLWEGRGTRRWELSLVEVEGRSRDKGSGRRRRGIPRGIRIRGLNLVRVWAYM